ncbi:MAG: hypothetical protein J6X44_02805 [Thermoguttaceae bacterium]|nr:hypothetical protein [Thermoguttaceae bacterium]
MLALRRNSDAAALLDSFRTSAFGRDTPALVPAYQAMLDLTNGKYDQVIDTLTRLLQVRLVSGTSNNYGSGYRTGYGANSGTD